MAKKPSKHSINVVSDHKYSLSTVISVFKTERIVYFQLRNLKDLSFLNWKNKKFKIDILTKKRTCSYHFVHFNESPKIPIIRNVPLLCEGFANL